MEFDEINSHIRQENRQYYDARQYPTDRSILLPPFALQEASAIAQTELISERKRLIPLDDVRQAKIAQFLGYNRWLCVHCGYDQR